MLRFTLVKNKLVSTDDLTPTDSLLCKVRPITSRVDELVHRITRFLTPILNQLLKDIPAHPTNTEVFLDSLCKSARDGVLEHYRNLINMWMESAFQAICELLVEHEKTVNVSSYWTKQGEPKVLSP